MVPNAWCICTAPLPCWMLFLRLFLVCCKGNRCDYGCGVVVWMGENERSEKQSVCEHEQQC